MVKIAPQDPIGAPSRAAAFQITEIRFHSIERFANFGFPLLGDPRGENRVDLRISKEVSEDQQLFDG